MKSETLKKIHYISGSKHEHRFSDPFFDLVQNTSLLRFWYLLRLCNFCKARGTCETKPNQTKVPAKYASLWIPNQKRPEDSRVLRVRRLWFPTSDLLDTWFIQSRTTWSRQYHE